MQREGKIAGFALTIMSTVDKTVTIVTERLVLHALRPGDAEEMVGAQIAWVVGVAWQRQGIASEAAVAVVDWLERRGIRVISANIHPRHVASQKVASRAGLLPSEDILDGEQVWRRPAA